MIDNASGSDGWQASDLGDGLYLPPPGDGYPMHPPPAAPADTGATPAAPQPDAYSGAPPGAFPAAPYPLVWLSSEPGAPWRGYGPPPSAYPYQSPYYPAGPRPANNLGVGGFVCGLLGVIGWRAPVVGLVLGVLGVVLSASGLVSANRTGSGRGLAIAGLVLGIIAVPMALLMTVLLVSYGSIWG